MRKIAQHSNSTIYAYNNPNIVALANYVVQTDWKLANRILNKYGYPEAADTYQIRDNLVHLISDKRYSKEALKDIIRLETPIRKLMIADYQDSNDAQDNKSSNFGGEVYGEYAWGGPRDLAVDHMRYGDSAFNWRNMLTMAPYKTPYEAWRSDIIQGHNYSGEATHKMGLLAINNLLIIIVLLVAFVYLMNKS